MAEGIGHKNVILGTYQLRRFIYYNDKNIVDVVLVMGYRKSWTLYDKPRKLGRSEKIKTLIGCLRRIEAKKSRRTRYREVS